MNHEKELIFISGASSDLGCEIIKSIHHSQTVIMAHYNSNENALHRLKKEIQGELILVPADFSNEKSTIHLINRFGHDLDFPEKFIHLPSPSLHLLRFQETNWKMFQENLNIQFRSAYYLLKTFLPHMAKRKQGKIVIMNSSVVTGVPPIGYADYISAKYALLGLTKYLSSEYARKKININSISPSMLDTKFLANIPHLTVKMNVSGLPKDIVPTIKFLLSRDSDFLFGANIPLMGETR